MYIKIAGGGPAGLYFAYLIKRSCPGYRVRVVEQNPADATYGFGVVLTGRALGFLQQGDPAVIDRLAQQMEHWSEQHIVLNGSTTVIDGLGISAIPRITMLRWLQEICAAQGVELEFGARLETLDDDDCDVLVAADGTNSVIRDRYPLSFDTRVNDLQNYFCWYGADVPFPAHTINFKQTSQGLFCGHYYRYAPGRSTFVPEIDPHTWLACGMGEMTDEQRKAQIESVFADELQGTLLRTNRTIWRRWRLVTNGRWYSRNIVLIGDALRTAHPSIASGTRLAMEDAIALWRAFETHGNDINAAFRLYESQRRPIREKLDSAADKSIRWYETVDSRMDLPDYEFVLSYLSRTGVISNARLEKESPDFVRRYREATGRDLG
jgi:2-polyprenyl-6-methoxyphenol hydroxylase-like FAD-dependent oxidoreductase